MVGLPIKTWGVWLSITVNVSAQLWIFLYLLHVGLQLNLDSTMLLKFL